MLEFLKIYIYLLQSVSILFSPSLSEALEINTCVLYFPGGYSHVETHTQTPSASVPSTVILLLPSIK